MMRLYKTVIALALCLFVSCSVFAMGKKDVQMVEPVVEEEEEIVEEESEVVEVQPPFPLPVREVSGEAVKYQEVWGYMLDNRRDFFKPQEMNITDLCVFSASPNLYGEINYIPAPPSKAEYKGRTHLVLGCEGRTLTHLILDPNLPARQGVIEAVRKAAKDYDGIQVDYENVPARDAENYLSFLRDLRKAIGNDKILSVAIAARTKTISDDIYNYKKVAPLVDRMIVMAYDEHWSGSKPGSIASFDWCERIVQYAQSVVPAEKLIMGLPFYGRTWVDENHASAWIYTSIERIVGENSVTEFGRENNVPYFSYDTKIHVTGYYEDAYSLVERCRLYKRYDVKGVAFWRIGQEDVTFWPWLEVED